MSTNKDDFYYVVVEAGQEIASEQVPTNGKEWIVGEFEGDAPSSSDGYVALVWDYEGAGEEILALTYTSKPPKKLNKVITGDGVKKLALVFHNSGTFDLAMGGCYKAKEL